MESTLPSRFGYQTRSLAGPIHVSALLFVRVIVILLTFTGGSVNDEYAGTNHGLRC